MTSKQTQPTAKITVFKANKVTKAYKGNPEERVRLCKTFLWDEETETIKKVGTGKIGRGEYFTAEKTLEELVTALPKLGEQRAICTGVADPKKFKPKGTVGWFDGDVQRIADNFVFTDENTLFGFDIDGNDMPLPDIMSFYDEIIPGFKDAGKLIVYSSSSGLITPDGEPWKSSTSAHVYVIISSGIECKENFGDLVFKLEQLHGHGFYLISKGDYPRFLQYALHDRVACGSERLWYEASPRLLNGVTQDRPEMEYIPGGVIDMSLIPAFTSEQEEELERIKAELKKGLKPNYEARKIVCVQSIMKKTGCTKKEAKEKMSEGIAGYMPEDAVLYFQGADEPVAVSKVLDDPDKYHFKRLADPQEPEYDNWNRTKAIFYANTDRGKKPLINSNAHGEHVVSFARYRKEVEAKKETSDEIERTVAKMNDSHAVCLVGSKFTIIKETHDYMTGGMNVSFLSIDTFKNFYKNKKTLVEMGDGKVKRIENAQLWMGHESRRTYEDFVFDPSLQAPKGYYNSFRGFNRVAPVKGDWSEFKTLMLNTMCSGRVELFRYTMAWFRNILINPHKKSNVALVMHGGMGCGKGTVVEWFREIFKAYYVQLTDGNQLLSAFNSLLMGKLLIYADESLFTGDKTVTNKMKGLITEDTMRVEFKGVDAIITPNFTNILISTNNEHAIDAAMDERRYVVYRFDNAVAQDRVFFGKVKKQKNNGGVAALCYHMLNSHDYDDIDVTVPFETDEMKEQKLISLDPVEAFWLAILTRGYIVTPPNNPEFSSHKIEWINDASGDESVDGFDPYHWESGLILRGDFIYDEYLLYSNSVNDRYPKNSTSFWQKTRRVDRKPIFNGSLKKRIVKNMVCFVIADIKEMRDDFSSNVVETDWDGDYFTPYKGQF